MLYSLLQAQDDSARVQRAYARTASGLLQGLESLHPYLPFSAPFLRRATAAFDVLAGLGITHDHPGWAITSTTIAGHKVPIEEEAVDVTPFCTLRRFAKSGRHDQLPVLIVAPISGHYATLLRPTVEAMLPDFDVHITDWHNIRDVPIEAGEFTLDIFIDHLLRFIRSFDEQVPVIAVCQPVPAALAATAILAAENDPKTPTSLTLIGGPVDTRISPTAVNDLATSRPLRWFADHLIDTVPDRYAGAGRRVYPGAAQLQAFLSMNVGRHLRAHIGYHGHLVRGEEALADHHRAFYGEYLAVMDLPAAFYLETINRIFQRHDLALGRFTHHGRPVQPVAIKDTALITIEGERDDICGVGQTSAAHLLCSNISPHFRTRHVQAGVGHYGVFSGKVWQGEIYPLLRAAIHKALPF